MDELRALAVSALLHDIGKFMQRADPGTKREFGHPELSEKFLDEKVTGIHINESEEFLKTVKFLVRHHHEKQLNESGKTGNLRALAEILSEADNISSRERDDIGIGKRLALMKPIFTEINNYSPEKNYYYKIAPLDFDTGNEILLPENINPSEIDKDYMEQWKLFLEEFKTVLKNDQGKLNPDSLYFLEEKYLWCIPSAYYKNNTDISLFEHSKVTAAAATSLYLSLKNLHPEIFSEKDPRKIRKIVKDPNEKRFLLTGIDINGIQKFIYSITSKKALKSLKSRSFYVQMLAQALTYEILKDEEIGLFETNIIYIGGGKSYLLLPVTVKEAVEKVSERINEALFKKYGTEFSSTIAYVELSSKDLSKEKPNEESQPFISLSWKKLSEKLSEKRNEKFTKLMEKNFEAFFAPKESGGYFTEEGTGDKRVICAICKKEIPESEAEPLEEGFKVCKECGNLIDLGRKLEEEKMFIVFSQSEINPKDATDLSVEGINTHIYVTNRPVMRNKNTEILILNAKNADLKNSNGFLLNSGGKPPVKELSDFALEGEGFRRIGILRMDVDNLGAIFQKGLPKSKRTLSRISQLSGAISMFFKGHLKEILNDPDFEKDIYVIYAGGDDLFAVGKWNKIPLFAKRIKEDFERYVCYNPNVTISGGIYLMKDKYPISRGAEYAGDAEEQAKSYKGKFGTKNAITFLGKALSWNDFEIAEKIAEKLKENSELSKEGKGSKSLIRRLQNIYSLYEQGKKALAKKMLSEKDIERKARWTKWLWMLAYYIGRSKEGTLEEIKTALATDEFEGMKSEKEIISYLDVPANWADLLTR